MKRIILFGTIALTLLVIVIIYIFSKKGRIEKVASAYGVPVVPYSYEPFLPFFEDTTGNYSLYRAKAIRINGNNNVFVLDAGNNRIMKYDKNGRFLQQIGRVGQGPGELLHPINFDIDNKGTIYVWNAGNGRMEIFNKNGEYTRSFKIPFSAESESGMAVGPDGNIYLNLPSTGSLIAVFSKNGRKIKQFGEIEMGKFKNPGAYRIWNQGSIRFDENGYLNFLFCMRPLFRQYNIEGDLILEKVIKGPEIELTFRTWEKHKKKYANSPMDTWAIFFYGFDFADNGDFFASLWAKKTIYHFSKDADIVEKLVPEVDDENLFTGRLSVLNDGRLLVLNRYNSDIQVFQKRR